MQLSESKTFFDGKVQSFANYAKGVERRLRLTNLDPAKRSSALILHIETVARAVSSAAGGDAVTDQGGVQKITGPPRNNFAPDAVGSAYHEVVRFSQFKRTAHTMDEYSVRFDSLRFTAESEEHTEGAFLEGSASVIFMQDASHSGSEKSLVLGAVQGNLGISAVARRMRRPFGPCGGAVRQDV